MSLAIEYHHILLWHGQWQIIPMKMQKPQDSHNIIINHREIPFQLKFMQQFLKVQYFILSVQSLSCEQFFATPWTAAHQASLSITTSWSLLKLMSIESVMPFQPSHPLSSLSSPAFNLSQHQGIFQWVSSSHQVAKVLEFQLQHQSFQWTLRTDLL